MSVCQDHPVTEETMDDAKALVDAVIEVLDDQEIARADKYAVAVDKVARSLAAMGASTADEDICYGCGEFFGEAALEDHLCEGCHEAATESAGTYCDGCGEYSSNAFDLSPSGLCHDCVNRVIEEAQVGKE